MNARLASLVCMSLSVLEITASASRLWIGRQRKPEPLRLLYEFLVGRAHHVELETTRVSDPLGG